MACSVVSLSTTPNRCRQLSIVVDSILGQSVRPDRIVLNVPDRYRGRAPYPSFEVDDGVEINRFAGGDLGPIAKILPTLDLVADPETVIITLDDDVAYPPCLLRSLFEAAREHPDMAFGSKGFVYDELGNIRPVRGNHRCCDVLQGYGAVLYRRGHLQADVLRAQLKEQPDRFRFSDDVILSNHLAGQGVARCTVELDEPLGHQPWADEDPHALKYEGGGTHKRYAEIREWLEAHGQWFIG